MNPLEAMGFYNFFMSAFSGNVTPSEAEIEAGKKVLKNMAGYGAYWEAAKKETYKSFVRNFISMVYH